MWIMMTFSFKIESNKDLKIEGLKDIKIEGSTDDSPRTSTCQGLKKRISKKANRLKKLIAKS
jgi:hypothetical protein